MCGIVGAVTKNNVATILLTCLKRLEYRGYDSAGIAVLHGNNLQRLRVVGKINALSDALAAAPLVGNTGIAHTRWATHGAPTEANAHPHFSDDTIGLVHNGIIENYQELREQLIRDGYVFHSETDTEVITHLIHKYCAAGVDFLNAVAQATRQLEGMYALAIVHSAEPGRIIGVRSGSSLVVGWGCAEGYFIASDRLALVGVVQQLIYLEEGDIVDLHSTGITIYDSSLQPVERAVHTLSDVAIAADCGKYKHYMQKEIFEQPQAIVDTLDDRLLAGGVADDIFGAAAGNIFPTVARIQIVACGTSYHAGLVGRRWIESLAGVPCQVDIASEFRYQNTPVVGNTLLVAISQSGETADTLAVVRQAKKMGYCACLAICNVAESSLLREADLSLLTHAGVEIGVAATKTFSAQLVALLLLALALGKHHDLGGATTMRLVQMLKHLPSFIEETLALDGKIAELAKHFINKQQALFIGRGNCYPVAMEGALKMKEISYIHAEAYAAGELKHGALALVDKDMPVIALVPNDSLAVKMQSNIKEVEARGGELIIFADPICVKEWKKSARVTILNMPSVPAEIAPLIYTIPLQLLAYHVAVRKGTDVDQPRNLAKSVTVE